MEVKTEKEDIAEIAKHVGARGVVGENGLNPHVRLTVQERDALVKFASDALEAATGETQNAPLPCPWCNHGAIESKLLGRHVKCPQRGCAGNARWFRYKAWNKRAPSVGALNVAGAAPINKSIPVHLELEEIAEKWAMTLNGNHFHLPFNGPVIRYVSELFLAACTEACQSRDEEIERLNRKLGEFTCRD